MLFLALTVGCRGRGSQSREPRGLLLRKGLVRWQAPVKDARTFVEENIRPKSLVLSQGSKNEEGFHCQQEGTPGLTQCVWACCVDLGMKDTVHFATLSFYKDRFYAYDVVFTTAQFPGLFSALEARFGKPSREQQESQINPAFALEGYGMSSYIVNTQRWDTGSAIILLADRGGQGKPSAGHMYVASVRIAREIPLEKKSEAGAKLPF